MTETISLTISKDLRENIDILRGDIPRSKFINKILETKVKYLLANKEIETNRGTIKHIGN